MTHGAGSPPGPTERWLRVGDLNMHLLDWGGDGEPVVALHGMASSCHWFDLAVPLLKDRYRFIALDQRAHGKTDQPPSGYDWATLGGDVAGVLDQMGVDRAVVMGHSWGASVALSVAVLHPGRVSALVMIDGGFSAGPRSPDMTWEEFRSRLRPRDIYGPRERYLGILRQQFAHCWSDQLERMVMTMPEVRSDGTLQERLRPANHEQILWAMWSTPPFEKLSLVQCPALLVAAGGRREWRNEEFLRRRSGQVAMALAALPDGQVEWVPDTGHDIAYERPGELATVLAGFLDSRLPSRRPG